MLVGCLQIHDAGDYEIVDLHKKMKAVGSLCIFNSFIYAAEGVLHGLNLRQGEE